MLRNIETLICDDRGMDSLTFGVEYPNGSYDLETISILLKEMNKYNTLRRVELPLFISDGIPAVEWKNFVDQLVRITTLQLYFRNDFGFEMKLTNPYQVRALFDGLSTSRSLKRLSIMPSRHRNDGRLSLEILRNLHNQAFADSFHRFLVKSDIVELHVPFLQLVNQREDPLLDRLEMCESDCCQR